MGRLTWYCFLLDVGPTRTQSKTTKPPGLGQPWGVAVAWWVLCTAEDLHWRVQPRETDSCEVQARLGLLLQGSSLLATSWVWGCTTKPCWPDTAAPGQRSGKGLCPSLLLPPSLQAGCQYLTRGTLCLHCDKDLEKKKRRDVLRCWMLSFLQDCLKMATFKSLGSAQL